MGGCLSCLDPRDPSLLAEYNPLLLGSRVENMGNSMYTQRLMEEYIEERVQPNIMSRDTIDPLNNEENNLIENINCKMIDN